MLEAQLETRAPITPLLGLGEKELANQTARVPKGSSWEKHEEWVR